MSGQILKLGVWCELPTVHYAKGDEDDAEKDKAPKLCHEELGPHHFRKSYCESCNYELAAHSFKWSGHVFMCCEECLARRVRDYAS